MLLAALLAALGPGGAAAHAPAASPVEPRFDPLGPDGPTPTDRLTRPDPAQRTGLRVALPLPDCRLSRSACDDVRLLNELDGFDLSPRLAVRFTGPIDPASVGPRGVFLVRLAAGPPEATGVDRIVYDAATHTLYARPDALLEPETRYGFVVTREVRDAEGRRIQPAAAFRRFLAGAESAGGPRGYRQALGRLMAVLGRRGLRPGDVAVASVFTTGSVSAFLEAARDALDRRPPPPALITAPEGGGRAYFTRGGLEALALRVQVRADPGAEGAFREVPLPLGALPADAVAGVGVGWFWTPWYLGPERRIAEGPTGRRPGPPPGELPVAFVVVVPAGQPPPEGWPVAVVGHGYGGEMFSSALLVAGTLARHGIATVAIDVVGHGGGPERRLLVRGRDGETRAVWIPGRGVDLDGDGRIEPAEGLAPVPGGASAVLGPRDGLRQQVVDLMALVRALRDGLDVDGDGARDLRGGPPFYLGHSLGGIYGALLLAVDPRVEVGVLAVPGGPVPEIARLSPHFRPLLREVLARRVPPLARAAGEFDEQLPRPGGPPVTHPSPEALAIQEVLARAEWLGRRGDPLAYARHLRQAPLPGLEPKRVLIQFARGDGVVPNSTTRALLRAGQLGDATALVRPERLGPLPPEWADPHGFLLRSGVPGPVGALARAAQEQAVRFFLSHGGTIWNPDPVLAASGAPGVFEIPAGPAAEGDEPPAPAGDARAEPVGP